MSVTDPEPGFRLVTIDRPDRRSALDRAAYAGLGTALTGAGRDASVRSLDGAMGA